MIRIGSTHARRTFSAEEIAEMIPILQRISRRSAERAIKRAQSYGRLRESEPEWTVLKHELRAIIAAWSAQVARLGCEPCELWTVGFRTEGGMEYWRYAREDDPLAEQTPQEKSSAGRG